MRTVSKNSRLGSTLLEAVLSLSMLGGVLASVALVSKTSSSAMSTSQTSARADERSRVASSQVVEVLRRCGRDSLTPRVILPLFTTEADFVRLEGVEDGEQQWGPLERIELQEDPGDPDNGLDDDGDGLIDERTLVRITSDGLADEKTIVICNNVSEFLEGEIDNELDDNGNGLVDEPGFCLTYQGELLTVRLTVVDVTPDGVPITTTSERNLALMIPGP